MVSLKTIAWTEILLGFVALCMPFASMTELFSGSLVSSVLWTELVIGCLVMYFGWLTMKVKM